MKELYQRLLETKLPVAYLEFKKEVVPPYIIYIDSGEDQRGSDFKNHISDTSFTVELYTTSKNLSIESLVDEALSFTEFSKETVYIQSENMYQTIYEFDITSKI